MSEINHGIGLSCILHDLIIDVDTTTPENHTPEIGSSPVQVINPTGPTAGDTIVTSDAFVGNGADNELSVCYNLSNTPRRIEINTDNTFAGGPITAVYFPIMVSTKASGDTFAPGDLFIHIFGGASTVIGIAALRDDGTTLGSVTGAAVDTDLTYDIDTNPFTLIIEFYATSVVFYIAEEPASKYTLDLSAITTNQDGTALNVSGTTFGMCEYLDDTYELHGVKAEF